MTKIPASLFSTGNCSPVTSDRAPPCENPASIIRLYGTPAAASLSRMSLTVALRTRIGLGCNELCTVLGVVLWYHIYECCLGSKGVDSGQGEGGRFILSSTLPRSTLPCHVRSCHAMLVQRLTHLDSCSPSHVSAARSSSPTMSYQLFMAMPPFIVTGCVGAVGKMNLVCGICEENISATSAKLEARRRFETRREGHGN